LDQFAEMTFPVSLQASERLVVDGTTLVRIYDSKGKQRTTFNLTVVPTVKKGNHIMKFNATFPVEENSLKVVAVFKTKGAGEVVKKD